MDQALPVSPDLAHALSTPAIATPAATNSLPAVAPTHSKEDLWRKAIHDQAASGKSILDFCQERGLAYGTFHRWKRSFAEADGATAVTSPSTSALPAQKDATANDTSEQFPHSASLSKAVTSLPRFAEIRLSAPHQEAPAPVGLELRCGKFSLAILPDCDRPLLREVLTLLGEIPC